jgi:Arginase family
VERLGVEQAAEAALEIASRNTQAIFLSLDIDVVDPANAPGTGTPEPGGLSSREMLRFISIVAREAPLCGMEVVEVSPRAVSSAVGWSQPHGGAALWAGGRQAAGGNAYLPPPTRPSTRLPGGRSQPAASTSPAYRTSGTRPRTTCAAAQHRQIPVVPRFGYLSGREDLVVWFPGRAWRVAVASQRIMRARARRLLAGRGRWG